MAVNVKQMIAAGFERAYWGLLDTTGILTGQAATAPAAGLTTGSPMGKMLGVKTSDVTIPEPEVTTVTGDDQPLGSFIFGSTANPTFNIEVGVRDLTFEAATQETKVMAIGDIDIGVLQPTDPTFPDVFLNFMRRAKSKVVGSDGVSGWEGLFIPKANVIPLGSAAYTERAAASYRYRVIANPCDKFPWGTTVSDTDNGTTGGALFPWSAENRLHVQRFTGDNTEDAFVLAYTPVTLAKCHIYVNGTKVTTGVALDVSTKTLTWTVPPGASAKIVVLYEHV